MSCLKSIIKKHNFKHFKRLKQVTAPLLERMAIPFFGFFRIESGGRFVSLSNDPEPLHFYYEHEKYLKNPYLSNPELFRSGYAISPAAFDSETLQVFQNEFRLYHFFLLLRQRVEHIDVFLFGYRDPDPMRAYRLISKSDLLQKFSTYFCREVKPIISEVLDADYNLLEAKKAAFLHPEYELPLLKTNEDDRLLKAIAPLSSQQEKCLELFKMGHSAQSAGAILGLSNRTVEYYFRIIKDKLGCSTKWDLLQW